MTEPQSGSPETGDTTVMLTAAERDHIGTTETLHTDGWWWQHWYCCSPARLLCPSPTKLPRRSVDRVVGGTSRPPFGCGCAGLETQMAVG